MLPQKLFFDLDDSDKVIHTNLLPSAFRKEFALFVDQEPDQELLNLIKIPDLTQNEYQEIALKGWNFKFAAEAYNGYLRFNVDLSSNKKNITPVNRYQLLVEAANDLIFEIDTEGHFTYLNPAALKISGFKEEEILGKVFLKVVREDWHERTIQFYMDQILKGTKSTYFEFPGITAQGKEVWIGQKVQLLEEESGIIGLMAVGRDITEHRLADEVLRKSEEKYRGIIQKLEAGLMEVDLDENIHYVNKALCDMLGYSEEELLGKSAGDLVVDKESRDRIDEEHKKREEGAGSVYEVKLNHKDGHVFWSLISGAPLYDADGKRTGSIGIHLDITDRKNAEVELKYTRERLGKYKQGLEYINEITSNTELSYHEQLDQGLATAASYLELPLGLISKIKGNDYIVEEYYMAIDNGDIERGLTFDFKKTYCEIVYAQETYVAINHFKESEYSGHPCYQIFGLETYIGAPYYVNGEKRGTVNFYAPAPREVPFDNYDIEFINLLSKWIGSLISQIETEKDLQTERVALNERNEELFRQQNFLNAINGFVTKLLDKESPEVIAWEIAESLIERFGFQDCVIYLLDADLGKLNQVAVYGQKRGRDREIIDPLLIPLGEGIVGTVAKTGKAELIGDTSKDKRYIVDDEVRLSELSVPIISDGEVVGVIDSEHPQKDFFTKEHLETLSTVANLAASRLKIAKATAKERELNELKSRFVAMASHEFRTPLTTIRQNADLVSFKLKKELPDFHYKYGKFLKRIESEIGRMTMLMNDMLTMGRIESGRIEIDRQPCSLDSLCKSVIDRHNFNRADNRAISFEVMGTARKVAVDEHLFDHILSNLISNAFKYSEGKRDPEFSIDFRKPESVELILKDYGIGIPKKDIAGLFESFYRATNVKNIQGSGLGLSIVKEFAEMHGGTINVESAINKGSTFSIVLQSDVSNS